MRKWLLLLLLWVPLVLPVQAGSGRYLTWLDDLGRVQNTFIEAETASAGRAGAAMAAPDGEGWTKDASGGSEAKRRYFTWVDASGALQSSFHVAAPESVAASGNAQTSGRDPLDDDYVAAEWLEERNFQADDHSRAYFTWVDGQGRVHNSPVGQGGGSAMSAATPIEFSEGRQVEFARPSPLLPDLDGQPARAWQPQAAPARLAEPHRELLERCCEQLAESTFIELSDEEPRYEEFNQFSPRLKLAHLDSRYIALKLPRFGQRYGLRVRSFANRQLVYPSLLFLDESRRPTRLVSEAVSTLHPESWHRYAFLEGVVPVFGGRGERYVLLLTTEEDRARLTLDNRPYKRPLQPLELNEAGVQVHRHAEEGSFELMVLR
jgi:hypothetical protein